MYSQICLMGPSKAVLTMSAPVLQPKSKTSKILFGPVIFFSFYLDIYGINLRIWFGTVNSNSKNDLLLNKAYFLFWFRVGREIPVAGIPSGNYRPGPWEIL
jgi:hypothetical protein